MNEEMKILVYTIILLFTYIIMESTSLRCSLVRMELESSCLLCKKSVAIKRPLHTVNNLHLISTLVGLLDDIVDNSVDKTDLPKNSSVCPSCFRSLEKANKLRQDLIIIYNNKILQHVTVTQLKTDKKKSVGSS